MAKQLKKWQGWLLFAGAMVAVFLLGLICSSLLERRAEVASVFNERLDSCAERKVRRRFPTGISNVGHDGRHYF